MSMSARRTDVRTGGWFCLGRIQNGADEFLLLGAFAATRRLWLEGGGRVFHF
jgi:hypothetical protein